MQYTLEESLQHAIKAAYAGADELKRYWGKLKSIRSKSTLGDLVTEADVHSEKAITDVIRELYPHDGILAEESGGAKADDFDRLWVIDPLDGTTNYTHQYPFVAVSIGLLVKGESVLGVIYNPFMNELFTAIKGKGALLNGEVLQVSTVPQLTHCLLATGFSYDRATNPQNNYAQFCQLTQICQGVRRCGAASLDLAYVAAGRLDGYWERGLQPWDMAAGILLVTEAGGQISSYDNQPINIFKGKVVASNGLIHQDLCLELKH